MRQPTRQATVLALAAIWIAGAVGCGDDAPTVAASSLSPSEFVAEAEEICARGRLQGLRFQPPEDGESEQEALFAAIDNALLPSLQGVIDEMYELGAPHGNEARIEALLIAMQKAVDEGEALDRPTVEKMENLLAPSGRLARKAGLESCIYG